MPSNGVSREPIILDIKLSGSDLSHLASIGTQIAVPFTATQLRNAECVYLGTDITPEQAKAAFGYAVPTELEHTSSYNTAATKVFDAERYGGIGVGRNGGAGRCGTFNYAYQIKGIGPTPLVAPSAALQDFWHSHGSISLVDSIQEAAWGEVFSIALPHGAVRVVAILSTGTECWYEGENGARLKVPRGLVVRPAAIRPAHFMRASLFRSAHSLKPDAERVQLCIQRLSDCLPLPTEPCHPHNRLELGLLETARRFAQQCATAQVLRLMHGALGPANIALDGRWLDFGTSTALPTHANTKSYGAPRTFSTLWEEHLRLESVFVELVFYINKYAKLSYAISGDALVGKYKEMYASSLRWAALRFSGIPLSLLPRQTTRHFEALGDVLVRVMRHPSSRRVEPGSSNLSALPHCEIGPLLRTLSTCSEITQYERQLAPLLPDAGLRNRLIESFRAAINSLSDCSTGQDLPRSVRDSMTIAGVKASKLADELFRINMRTDNLLIAARTKSAIELSQNVTDKISRIRDLACTLFTPSTSLSYSFVMKQGAWQVFYDLQNRSWHLYEGSELVDTSEEIALLRHGRDVLTFFGDGIAI